MLSLSYPPVFSPLLRWAERRMIFSHFLNGRWHRIPLHSPSNQALFRQEIKVIVVTAFLMIPEHGDTRILYK